MTNVTNLHGANPEAARDLVNSIPPGKVNRKQFTKDLPNVLEAALTFLLEDIDAGPGQSTSSAVGCRIVAACIARLRG